MNYLQFTQILKQFPQAELVFTSPYDSQRIALHSHLTEVKQQTIQSVDCGGKVHSWQENVIQLWHHDEQDDGHRVNSGKALSIKHHRESKSGDSLR